MGANADKLIAEIESGKAPPIEGSASTIEADNNKTSEDDTNPVAEATTAVADSGAEDNAAKIAKALKIESERRAAQKARKAANKSKLETAPPSAQSTPSFDPDKYRSDFARKFLEDPIAAYRELGLDPAKAYETTTARILQSGTPEEKLREQLRAEFREELSKRDRATEDERSAAQRREADKAQETAEREFRDTFRRTRDQYPALDSRYRSKTVVKLAEAALQEYAAKYKTPFSGTYEDILEYLEKRESIEAEAVKARQARREAKKASNADTGSGEDSRGSTTLNNGIASRKSTIANANGSWSREAERKKIIAELEAREAGSKGAKAR